MSMAQPDPWEGTLSTGDDEARNDRMDDIPLTTITTVINSPNPSTQIVPDGSQDERFSQAATLGQRLHEDIDDGRYQCGVCYEAVKRTDQIWYCQSCWSIYDYQCIVDWAFQSGQGESTVRAWKCPSCRRKTRGPPLKSCWCTRDSSVQQDSFLPPNSCGRLCLKFNPCGHPCEHRCHTGPCGCPLGCEMDSGPIHKARTPSARTETSSTHTGSSEEVTSQSSAQEADAASTPSDAGDRDAQVLTAAITPPELGGVDPQWLADYLSRISRTAPARPLPHGPGDTEAARRTQMRKASGRMIFTSAMLTMAVALWTYALTILIVRPFNNRDVAENDIAVRALWAFTIIAGLICTIVNCYSLPRWMTAFTNIDQWLLDRENRMRSRRCCGTVISWLEKLGLLLCLYLIYALRLLRPFLVVFWIFGPFFAPIAIPISARSTDFHDVCKGFDTRVILDYGNELRMYPIFHDLGPEAYNTGHYQAAADAPGKVGSYTMAILSRFWPSPQTSTSLELNFYDPSYREVFGIPEGLANQTATRDSIYALIGTDSHLSRLVRTHTKDMDEPNPNDAWAEMTSTKNGPSVTEALFGLPYDQSVPYTIQEEPGFYRTRYNWNDGTWTSGILAELQQNGTRLYLETSGSFNISQHLILPGLGLQVPNFADFARSCKCEPYLKMYRGNGSLAELERQGKQEYKHDNSDLVLRAAVFGPTQGKLELCARRRDLLDKSGSSVVKGLGERLPVVAGLLASYRYEGWSEGRRKGCKGLMSAS